MQGAADPGRLMISIMQSRQRAMEERERQRIAKIKAASDAKDAELQREKTQLENAEKRLSLLGNLQSTEAGLAPLAEAANNPGIGMAAQQATANQFVQGLESQIGARTSLGQDPQSAGLAVGTNANPNAARGLEGIATVREEFKRTNAREADKEQDARFAEQARIKEIGLIPERKVAEIAGKVAGVTDLVRERRSLRKSIKRMESRGEDASALREEERVLSQFIKGAGKEGQISITNIPGSEIPKQISALSNMRGTTDRIEGLVSDIDSGAIKVGPRGFVTSLGVRARGIAREVLASPDVQDQKIKDLVQRASAADGAAVQVETSEGKQLSLTIDQLALAWDFVKAKRESARFTILELETILKQLNFTDPTKTPKQIRGILGKIYEEALRSQNKSRTILNAAGVDPAQFESSLGLTDEDRAAVERIGDFSANEAPLPVPDTATPPSGGFDALPTNPSDDDLLNAIRNSRGAPQ